MVAQEVSGETTTFIDGLGRLKGLLYSNGVRQFNGIPYGRIAKRWTRSILATSWENEFHDGTKLGPSAPIPPEYIGQPNNLTPVPQFMHLPIDKYSERECLVMNVSLPPESHTGLYPVLIFCHGGAFIYGGANRSVYDTANLASWAIERGTPIVVVALNYRVGIWGFLACQAIREDLARDGFGGVGNFGITDQQIALAWVQKYIHQLGGDKSRVTFAGESAGGTSVALHLLSPSSPGFNRAIAMSGGHWTIRSMTLEEHEQDYRSLLRFCKIDPDAADALEQLRNLPEAIVNAGTLAIKGTIVATYNPCEDGVTIPERISVKKLGSPPSWLEAYMVGDVKDEGVIFEVNQPFTYTFIRTQMSKFLSEHEIDDIFRLYSMLPDISEAETLTAWEAMSGDAIFRAETYISAHRSKIPRTYAYHFDEVSSLEHELKGTAYHAIDMLYLFRNLREAMTPSQLTLSDRFSGDWIDFCYGKEPWQRFGVERKWRIFGPEGQCSLKTESQDEEVRHYQRTDELIRRGLLQRFVDAIDHIAWGRFLVGRDIYEPAYLSSS